MTVCSSATTLTDELEAHVATSDDRGLVLDATIFYPHGGGSPAIPHGDLEDGTSVPVIDTLKGEIARDRARAGAGSATVKVRRCVWCSTGHGATRTCACTRCHLLSSVAALSGHGRRDPPRFGRLDFDMPAAVADRTAIEANVTRSSMPRSTCRASGSPTRTSTRVPNSCARSRWRHRAAPAACGWCAWATPTCGCGGTHVPTLARCHIVVRRIENKGRQNARRDRFARSRVRLDFSRKVGQTHCCPVNAKQINWLGWQVVERLPV